MRTKNHVRDVTNGFAPRFDVLYKPYLWTEVCCKEDRLLKNLPNINLTLFQIVFFSVSGETKELSDK